MQRRRIGSLEVSVAGLGCNNFGTRLDEQRTARVVHAALDAGITLFDTADVYGAGLSEEYLGRALGARRDDVVIASKFGMQMQERVDGELRPVEGGRGASRRWIERAVEDSLRRLGTDRIDLYQLHAPDPETPIDETLDALDALVRAGKVREIGHSNLSGAQIDEAEARAGALGVARFVCAQNRLSLLDREALDDVVPACERLGLAFLPYFPLASGLLTGKYRRGEPPPPGTRLASVPDERRAVAMADERMALVERLAALAGERGITLVELAVGWLLALAPVASVIAGATTPEQVAVNAAAARPLAPEDLAAVDAVLRAPATS